MANPPHRLSEIVQGLVAEQGWRASPSLPDSHPTAQDASQLVFIGNWQDPCPRRLLFDPDLEPIDIVAWQVIRVYANASTLVAFPPYEKLMQGLKVARATVARALAVLRLTRWLPLCAALRDPQGRFSGHVYALNDEPVPLPEMLTIDAAYVPFVEQARNHRNAHVRTLAGAAYDAITEWAAEQGSHSLAPVRLGDHFGARLANLIGLLNETPAATVFPRRQVQKVNTEARVQILNAGRSSRNLEKETTTTAGASLERRPAVPSLVYPAELSLTESQRRVLGLRLEQVSPALRQDILDEAAGRILAKRSTADPVRCEFDYLARLCIKAKEGGFVFTDAGEGLRRKRAERARGEERLARARARSEALGRQQLEAHRARRDYGSEDKSDDPSDK